MKKNILKYMSITLAFVVLFCSLASLSFSEVFYPYADKSGFYIPAVYWGSGGYTLTYDAYGPVYYSSNVSNSVVSELAGDDVPSSFQGHWAFVLDQENFSASSDTVEYCLLPSLGWSLSSTERSLFQGGNFDLKFSILNWNGKLMADDYYVFVGKMSSLYDFWDLYRSGQTFDWRSGCSSLVQAFQNGSTTYDLYGAAYSFNQYYNDSVGIHWRTINLTVPCHFPDNFDGSFFIMFVALDDYPGAGQISMMPSDIRFVPTGDTELRWTTYFHNKAVEEGLSDIEEELSSLNSGIFGDGYDPWEGEITDVWPTDPEIESSVDDLIDAEEQLTQDLHGGIGGVIRDQDVDAALEGHSNVFTFFSDAFDRLCLQNGQIYSLIIYALILGIVVMLIGRRIYV